MEPTLKELTEFFVSVGAENVSHTDKGYLAHAVGVHRDLRHWGCSDEICRAGMYHSIYGTELFQGFKLPLERRADVSSLIGERAERLAYLNCAMDRASFDRAVERGEPPYHFVDRFVDEDVEIDAHDFEDLCTIHLCDWLEQLPRGKDWDYRREAYLNLGRFLGGIGNESLTKVYALETPAT